MIDQDDMNAYTDGDDYVIETAFGEARFSLADSTGNPDDNWSRMPLEERWRVLFEETESAIEAVCREEL